MYWWMILIAVLAAAVYGYTISSQIKVASPTKPGCSSCPSAESVSI